MTFPPNPKGSSYMIFFVPLKDDTIIRKGASSKNQHNEQAYTAAIHKKTCSPVAQLLASSAQLWFRSLKMCAQRLERSAWKAQRKAPHHM